jgi:signal peptidase I
MTQEGAGLHNRNASQGSKVGIFWWILPALAFLFIGVYAFLAIAWQANPPFVPVMGSSMYPVLKTGDLVLLHGIKPSQLRVGMIVAEIVPTEYQAKYNLPGQVVHKIIKIERGPEGIVIQTKGVANPGPDVFLEPANGVIGKEIGVIPYAGYLFIFFQTLQGRIFLATVVFLIVTYIIIGVVEDSLARRKVEQVNSYSLEDIKEVVKNTVAAVQPNADNEHIKGIVEATKSLVERHVETQKQIGELLDAINEYGIHLKTHTEVIKNLGQTTQELKQAASRLSGAVEKSGSEADKVDEKQREQLTEPQKQPKIVLRRSLFGYVVKDVDELLGSLLAKLDERDKHNERLREAIIRIENELSEIKKHLQ